jgi:hypothetical protein
MWHELGLELLQRASVRCRSLRSRMKPVKNRLAVLISPTASSIGKVETVLALADHHAADPDDALLAGAQIAREIFVVALAIGRRHHHPDVLPITSFAPYPNSRSAAVEKNCMMPRSSITIMASGTVAKIDSRCASRRSDSRRVSRSRSPNQADTRAQHRECHGTRHLRGKLRRSGVGEVGPFVRRVEMQKQAQRRAVQSEPEPPSAAAISTGGMRNK